MVQVQYKRNNEIFLIEFLLLSYYYFFFSYLLFIHVIRRGNFHR